MKIKFYLFILLAVSLFSCSEKEESNSCMIDIQVIAPEGYDTLPYEKINVVLTNQNQGITYAMPCSSEGLAAFRVEYGYYTASAHYQTASGLIFSGRTEALSLLSEQYEGTAKVQLSRSRSNALIIKEIYYGGCIGRKGEEYQSDQYLILHNNSEETLYLDSLCVAIVDPASSLQSPWIKYTDMKRIPINDVTWQFPGTGTEYPLHPGEEISIATNAVDHTGGEYQHTNSVDLSKADWAFWDVSLSQQDITAGVRPMKMLLNLNTNIWMYPLPAIGPTMIVFKIEGKSAESYVNDISNRENRPQSSNTKKFYLMIPKEWVIDCVECVASADRISYKRVPDELDSGAAYLPDGPYTGKSLIRKSSLNEDGRIIYQDTNNSSNDMTTTVPTLKNRK